MNKSINFYTQLTHLAVSLHDLQDGEKSFSKKFNFEN